MPAPVELLRPMREEFSQRPVVLVTGGTGIVGSALISRLTRTFPESEIVLFTRKPGRAAEKRVTLAHGDLESPGIGLSDTARRALQARTVLIVHCAADTRFNLPIDEARRANVLGTRYLLNFALGCPQLVQFAHISTLYVAGMREGLLLEGPLRHGAGYVNTYEQSKHEAEELVLEGSARLPVGIYRLSSVIDASGTGGHFRQAIRFVPWCPQFPFFPADVSAPVDLISSKWAAKALTALIADHFTPGCIRHVCAGAERSMTVGEVMDCVFEAYEIAPAARPQLVSLEDFATLRETSAMPSGPARALTGLMTFIPHLSLRQPFDVSVSEGLLRRSGVAVPDMKALLAQVLEHQLQFAGASL